MWIDEVNIMDAGQMRVLKQKSEENLKSVNDFIAKKFEISISLLKPIEDDI